MSTMENERVFKCDYQFAPKEGVYDGYVCKGNLQFVPADEPWHDDYYICEVCDSTYNTFDKKFETK